MDNALVSVGIPTYNRPEGLRSILDDICNQTYHNIEIIVSDNCSTEPKVKVILEEFSLKDSRIRFFIQSENKGSAFNFQFVLEKASGEYFMWAADDDSFADDFVNKCLNLFAKFPNSILSTTACQVNNNHNSTSSISENFQTIGLKPCDRIKITIKNTFRPNTMFYSIFKKDYLILWNFPKYYGSDISMLIFMSQFGEFAVDNNYIGYNYNLNPGALSADLDSYKIEAGFNSKFKKHFFVTISLKRTLIGILNLKEISIFQRIRLMIYYVNCLRKDFRYSYMKDEIFSFFRIMLAKINFS